jgi:hypothetical protein
MLIAVLGAAFAVAGAAPARSVTPLQKAALRAVDQAVKAGRLDGPTAASARAQVNRAAYLARTLPSGRREHLVVALGEVAALHGLLTQPRAVTVTGVLKTNSNYFSKHYAPAPQTDITDEDGVVYRYFAGRCFEYHPLANFGALNAHVAAGDADGATRLADALVARGTHLRGGGIGWEYLFPFGGGRAPWLSGMAQAVAAQSLARTAAVATQDSTSLAGTARAAYQAIPGRLLTSVAAGPWIRLYSFTSLTVLNAQLQAVISLQAYATAAEDDQAAALALRMQRAAAATLARFDTGYWSYYALPHDPSPLDYHEYVVQLLRRLAPTDARFADAAVRFARYEKEAPAFQLAQGGLGTLTFWVSKPATVSALSAAGPARRVSVLGGWHTLRWSEPKRAGTYGVRVTATDVAGNRASFDALPFVRATSTVGAKAARSTADAAPAVAPRLDVGVALDDVSQATTALQAGISRVRIGVAWPPGAAAPDEGVLTALRQLPPGVAVTLELNATPLPADDAGRAALAQYALALAANVPGLATLVLGPAPVAATAPAYAAAFAAIRAALPNEPLGIAIDGALDPLGASTALSGIDTNVVAFRPAPTAAKGAWTLSDVARVGAAFPQTTVVVDGVPAPYPASLRAVACTPALTAVFLDRLSDALRPAVRSAVATAERGAFVCPGLGLDALPTTVQYPASLAQERTSVRLACNRDCLYLVTLDDSQGRPVVAKRGQLVGGAPGKAATVTLPKAKLVAGRAYTVAVRLVARVNPGRVTRFVSPPLQRSG